MMEPTLAEISAKCWELRVALDAARARSAPAAELRRAATAYALAANEYQRVRYGSIRKPISVAALLR